MKKQYLFAAVISTIGCLLITGCSSKKSKGVWEDSNSSTAYKYKNAQSLWTGEGGDDFAGPANEDFVPLRDEDLKTQFADGAIPQSKNSPGEGGIPGIDQFQKPSAEMASLFRSLYFNTDDHILRGQDSLVAIDKMAAFLKDHPQTYIVVEGHCDERGPEAYNLSLGARRANYVRSMLVKKGVNLNQIHTISYGKERPYEVGHNPDSWSKNRRAEFKINQR